MASIENRVAMLEADRTIARREYAALTELTAASVLGIHREIEHSEARLTDRIDRLEAKIDHLEHDVSAILKILNDHYRKS